jgi:hypothetical protein
LPSGCLTRKAENLRLVRADTKPLRYQKETDTYQLSTYFIKLL